MVYIYCSTEPARCPPDRGMNNGPELVAVLAVGVEVVDGGEVVSAVWCFDADVLLGSLARELYYYITVLREPHHIVNVATRNRLKTMIRIKLFKLYLI